MLYSTSIYSQTTFHWFGIDYPDSVLIRQLSSLSIGEKERSKYAASVISIATSKDKVSENA